MNPMSTGLVAALVAGGFFIGFLLGFFVRSQISRVRRRRWKQMIADGVMTEPGPTRSPDA
jgi:hypothetical protein